MAEVTSNVKQRIGVASGFPVLLVDHVQLLQKLRLECLIRTFSTHHFSWLRS